MRSKKSLTINNVGVLLILTAIGLSVLTRAEESNHEQAAETESLSEKHPAKPNNEKQACWHAQLMQLNSSLVNSPKSIPDIVLEIDEKKFRHNNKPYASTEMYLGSRMDVFETSDACELVISFRGTYEKSLTIDLLQDFYFASATEKAEFHPGFVSVAQSYKRNIKQVLAESRTKCGREDLKVTLTGQSLGGAVAYVVANIFDDVNLGTTELVVFGSPRVVRHSSKHKDRVKAVHYYLDQDPVVLAPPALMYRELTDNLYRFSKVPITQEVKFTGQELIQNHLPNLYAEKMSLWCQGKESPVPVNKITHTLRGTGWDVSKRVARAAVDAGGKAVLPDKNQAGGKLPRVSETVEALLNQKGNSKPNPKYFNSGDGKSLAVKLACHISHVLGTKTKAGRAHYCSSTTGFNGKAKKACEKVCESEKLGLGTCLQGCFNHFHQFCIGNWSCQGNPLSG